MPLFDTNDSNDGVGGDDHDVYFKQCISEMVDILHPTLYDMLLPAV